MLPDDMGVAAALCAGRKIRSIKDTRKMAKCKSQRKYTGIFWICIKSPAPDMQSPNGKKSRNATGWMFSVRFEIHNHTSKRRSVAQEYHTHAPCNHFASIFKIFMLPLKVFVSYNAIIP